MPTIPILTCFLLTANWKRSRKFICVTRPSHDWRVPILQDPVGSVRYKKTACERFPIRRQARGVYPLKLCWFFLINIRADYYIYV